MEIENETTPTDPKPEPERPPSPELKSLEEYMAKYGHVLEEEERLMEATYDPDEPSWDTGYLYHPGGNTSSFRFGKEEERTVRITKCARLGLAKYNEENKTDYYFDSYVDLNFYVKDMGRCCLHSNFLARPKTSPKDDGDFARKLFFAEVWDTVFESSASCCSMLSGAERKLGCGICPGLVHHPTSGFSEGLASDADEASLGS